MRFLINFTYKALLTMNKQAIDQTSYTLPGPDVLSELHAGRGWLARLSEGTQVFSSPWCLQWRIHRLLVLTRTWRVNLTKEVIKALRDECSVSHVFCPGVRIPVILLVQQVRTPWNIQGLGVVGMEGKVAWALLVSLSCPCAQLKPQGEPF